MRIRAYIKVLKVIGATIFYVSIILFRQLFKGKDLNHAFKIRKSWAKYATKAFGIEAEYFGNIPKKPSILISNHRSLTDPVVQLTQFYALPVAKAEISKYPIIGFAADLTGIVFIDRSDKKSRKDTRTVIKDLIQQNRNILLYPEGTVGAFDQTKTFSKGSFEIAAQEGIPIIPVAIEYSHKDNRWTPDLSTMDHFVKSLGMKKIKVKLYIGEPLEDTNSWSLMKKTQDWINEKLTEAQMSWEKKV